MRWTGYVVLAFIVYHLAQFTFGSAQSASYQGNLPAYTMAHDYRVLGFTTVRAGTPVADVRRMVILGFENRLVAVCYIFAVGLLSLHLWHGADSLFQTFGWRNGRWSAGLHRAVFPGAAPPLLPRQPRHSRRGPWPAISRRIPPAGPSRHADPRQWPNSIPRSPPARCPASGAGTRRRSSTGRQPGEQAEVRDHRRRIRSGRRLGRRQPGRELGYRVKCASSSMTARAVRTRSQPRGESTRPRTTRTTATVSSGSSTTRSRAATSAPARPTSTGSRKSRSTSSTSAVAQGVPFARRVRRDARQPIIRRRTGFAHLLCARPDWPAAPPRRLRRALSRLVRAGAPSNSITESEMLRRGWWWAATPRGSSSATSSPGRSAGTAADAVILATGGYGNRLPA